MEVFACIIWLDFQNKDQSMYLYSFLVDEKSELRGIIWFACGSQVIIPPLVNLY